MCNHKLFLIEGLFSIFYPDDFMKKYVTRREEAMARQLAMLDPTNPEGQRLIAEQIEQENISYTQEFAMEHMPEAYIPVTMLFIKMKINGVEVKAFIDSGSIFRPSMLCHSWNSF